MKLIVVTQHVDPDHSSLGATVPMLRALAARVDELVVLADALAELLSDRGLVERLAGAARESALPWILSPEDFAERQVEIVERVIGG